MKMNNIKILFKFVEGKSDAEKNEMIKKIEQQLGI